MVSSEEMKWGAALASDAVSSGCFVVLVVLVVVGKIIELFFDLGAPIAPAPFPFCGRPVPQAVSRECANFNASSSRCR
ncbi:MAG: hypothetical protein AUI16_01020 [Alphaproteobacteria bacterium 13_2_20CM_2_64_7]|jgi:hypothetical protein|nr:MAG: hypothetical protein AUI16_01020 [Alphaproteobacteria bacterium 13_2_20CM_2_64_7]